MSDMRDLGMVIVTTQIGTFLVFAILVPGLKSSGDFGLTGYSSVSFLYNTSQL